MVCVPDAVSPVSESPAVNVTTISSPTFAVLPLIGETEVTVNVGGTLSAAETAPPLATSFDAASTTSPLAAT